MIERSTVGVIFFKDVAREIYQEGWAMAWVAMSPNIIRLRQ